MTSADFARNRENYCYRHRDRQSFVLCQRCLRTVCPDCQAQAPVGVICPECVKAQRKAESPSQRRARRQNRSMAAMFAGRPPTVTTAIIAVTAFVSLLQMIPGGFGDAVTRALMFYAPTLYPTFNGGHSEVWRLVTPLLVHGGLLHLALNMLALYVIGRSLETMLGWWRFLVLYLVSGIGGSVAVALIAPGNLVVGASGAIFGLFGALLVMGRKAGANLTGILIILAANLVIGFVPGFHIAWQAHIGGAIVGAAIAAIYVRTARPNQRRMQLLLLGALLVVLAVLLIVVVPMLLLARVMG